MSDKEEHSENEFYSLGELDFQDNSDLIETNNKLVREKTKETTKKTLKL